ncbi:DUF1553 domain-containing protein [Planctomycetaceae bacterium]|jgi:hypothetical protein|nr:DUF1553 domain-containing protein [Planctomycetaceae bacterium]MDG2391331.1 DUF1553 domain-containing protein [Planctomycetaceae bacterium]
MMFRATLSILVGTVVVISVCAVSSASEPTSEALEFFENRIRPVLVKHCYECHAPEAKTVQGNFLLHTREGLLKGGDSGPAIVSSNIDKGILLESLRYETFEMPPSGKLPKRVIDDFEKWIKMGAPDPRTGPSLESAQTIDLERGRQFWAFVPLQKVETLQSENLKHHQHPIDSFVQQQLDETGLSPSPLASREVLVRRLYYDLVGLPPTPKQIDQFLKDDSRDAYANLVDQLLSSRAFGERWGRHWLDVARYADSTGGGRSRLYGNSWRYRDYVIESFHRDKPFNQFVKEQIAGDLLPAGSLEEEREQLVACGFLMLGPHNYELQDKELLRMEVVDEQITTLGKAFLGMTIGCARCHDHKFDPIPTTDYYALAGIFRSTKSLGTGNVTNWITREMPVDPEQEQALAAHRKQLDSLNQKIANVDAELKRHGARKALPQVPIKQLAGLVRDSDQREGTVGMVGEWQPSVSVSGFVSKGYFHDMNQQKGEKKAVFTFALPEPGQYEVRVSHVANPNRATNVPVTVRSGEKVLQTVSINQRKPPKIEGGFNSLGVHEFTAKENQSATAVIEVSTEKTNGVVIVDTVQLISVKLLNSNPQLASSSLKKSSKQTKKSAAQFADLKKQRAKLNNQLKALTSQAPPSPPQVMAVQEQSPEELGDMELCIRGNIRNLGDVVPRGVLSVASPSEQNRVQTEFSGRLELAEWIASAENPLTARVMVNRIWAHLFGSGIVRTVDNFGSMGERPFHPKLLDFLAVEFVNRDWSVKQLIRQIVMSRTYQTSSRATEQQLAIDPENRWLSHFPKRRADAEYLRDALLTISGKMEVVEGGPTVKPGTNSEFGYVYTSRRRSVYLPVFRNQIEEMLSVFNFPDPNLVQGQRVSTTLATQALYMMNHPRMLEFSTATAERLLSLPEITTQQRLQWVYRFSVGRLPTDSEVELCLDYLRSVEAENLNIDRAETWAILCQTLFSSIDFRYIE